MIYYLACSRDVPHTNTRSRKKMTVSRGRSYQKSVQEVSVKAHLTTLPVAEDSFRFNGLYSILCFTHLSEKVQNIHIIFCPLRSYDLSDSWECWVMATPAVMPHCPLYKYKSDIYPQLAYTFFRSSVNLHFSRSECTFITDGNKLGQFRHLIRLVLNSCGRKQRTYCAWKYYLSEHFRSRITH
jgi:hypothetical protein